MKNDVDDVVVKKVLTGEVIDEEESREEIKEVKTRNFKPFVKGGIIAGIVAVGAGIVYLVTKGKHYATVGYETEEEEYSEEETEG